LRRRRILGSSKADTIVNENQNFMTGTTISNKEIPTYGIQNSRSLATKYTVSTDIHV
jgi:hypothetical protein